MNEYILLQTSYNYIVYKYLIAIIFVARIHIAVLSLYSYLCQKKTFGKGDTFTIQSVYVVLLQYT